MKYHLLFPALILKFFRLTLSLISFQNIYLISFPGHMCKWITPSSDIYFYHLLLDDVLEASVLWSHPTNVKEYFIGCSCRSSIFFSQVWHVLSISVCDMNTELWLARRLKAGMFWKVTWCSVLQFQFVSYFTDEVKTVIAKCFNTHSGDLYLS